MEKTETKTTARKSTYNRIVKNYEGIVKRIVSFMGRELTNSEAEVLSYIVLSRANDNDRDCSYAGDSLKAVGAERKINRIEKLKAELVMLAGQKEYCDYYCMEKLKAELVMLEGHKEDGE